MVKTVLYVTRFLAVTVALWTLHIALLQSAGTSRFAALHICFLISNIR